MKKIFYLIVILGFFSLNNSFAQPFVEQVSGVTTTLKSAYALAQDYGNTAWVCGYSGVVLRTINSGTNWINVSGNGIPNTVSLISICGINQTTAVTAGYIGSNTFVYRTSNGGANWTQVFTETGGFIDAVYLSTNSGTGFMVGDPVGGRWSLWKTTNSGANWDSAGLYLPQAGTEAGWNNSLIVNGNHIWFGTNNSRIYHSRNLGLNWTAQSTSPEVNSYAVYFAMMDTAYGYAGGTTILLTTNGGMNWSDTTAPGTGMFGGFSEGFVGAANSTPTLMFYVRTDNTIYRHYSFSGGWGTGYTAPTGTYSHISPYMTSLAYAVRTLGGITRLWTFYAGVKKISTSVPDGFKLYDNYPNPFNPSTKIKFSLPRQSLAGENVHLSVYDALGREIETLVNEKLTAGTYEVEWSAEKYTSGIYFYRLTTEGYSVTKKMILLK